MRSRESAPDATPAKEIVAQIRNIHLALITISVAIAIWIFGSNDAAIGTALTQVLQIKDLINNWQSVRRKIYIDAVSSVAPDFQSIREIGVLQLRQSPVRDLEFEDVLRIETDKLGDFAQWQFEPDMDLEKHSLSSFRRLWDQFQRGISISVPKITLRKATSSERQRATIPKLAIDETIYCSVRIRREYSNVFLDSETPSRCFRARPSAMDEEDVPAAKTKWGQPRASPSPEPHRVIDLILDRRGTRTDPRDVTVTIPFDIVKTTVPRSAIRGLYGSWRGGVYSDAFLELAEASADFENVDIEDAVQRIRTLQSNNPQVLDLFGLKIPNQIATITVLVILAAIQSYFLLNLQELISNVRRSKTAPREAWIGLYRSKIAFAATEVTACALPFFAAIGLALKLWKGLEVTQSLIGGILTGLIALAFAFITGWILWRLRRLTMPLFLA